MKIPRRIVECKHCGHRFDVDSDVLYFLGLGILLGFLLALVLCQPANAQERESCTIPFRTSRSLMLVSVTFDGNPKTLIFDTGAERTMVHSVSGDVEHRATLIVGNRAFVNFPVILADLSGLPMKKAGADGVLGQDFLRRFSSVSIDYNASTITLRN